MNFNLIALVCLILILVVLVAVSQGGSKKALPVKRKDFMTKNELEFWRILVPAARPLHVGPQVAMSALVTTTGKLDKSARTTARNSFDRKCVDFVLFDDAGIVQLVVELDDVTHKAEKDAARDRLTTQAGYRTLRVRRKEAASVGTLEALIAAKLATPGAVQPATPFLEAVK
ncbi:MAG: DUF2726 domain-containing protein [Sandarakinorhabdus sp.]|nr:DUF2726 domain-containing protein [Sandarakinorhabdus sp.]